MKLLKTLPVGFLETNCYLLGDSESGEALVIDPGGDKALILDELKKMGLKARLILLTHGHPDHYGAALELAADTGAPIYMHPQDSAFYRLKVDRELSDGQLIQLGSLRLKVLHTPGHTPGSVCFLDEEDLFSGDTLFCGAVGRTDFPGGDTQKMRDSLEKFKSLSPTLKLYPGHGETGTLEEELAENPFLTEEIEI